MLTRLKMALLIALGFALTSCAGEVSEEQFTAVQNTAEAKVERFHQQYGTGDYGGVWDEARVDLREATSREDWVALMEGMQTSLGDIVESELETVSFEQSMGVPIVNMTYLTQFEASLGRETFQFVGGPDTMTLRGFEIEAPVEDTREP